MRAAVVPPPGERFKIEEVQDPTPDQGQIVVKVARCGICGTDLHWTSGHSGNGFVNSPGSIIGHEWSGEVVAVGRHVSMVKVGDNISAMCGNGCGKCLACFRGEPIMCEQVTTYLGGFGQYSLIHESAAVILPRTLSLNDGALVEPLAVGLHACTMGGLQTGDRVLVLGAGSISLAVIFWARRFGAQRIVAASRSPRRERMALAMGADEFVLTSDDDVHGIEAALGGQPEVVFEGVGVPGVLSKAIGYVRRNGTVVSLGFCTNDDPIVPGLASMKQVRLIFPVCYTRAEFEHAARALDQDAVPDPRMIITNTVGLDTFPEKIEELRGANNETKVLVNPWG